MSMSSTPALDTSRTTRYRAEAASAPPAEAPEYSPSFGSGYRVLGIIGRGGMGTVVRVERACDGRSYALKYCHPGTILRRRFVREVRLLGALRHPNIVPIVDAQLNHPTPFFVMPLASGSLQEEVENLAGKLPAALRVFREICAGVRAIHDSGIVHRDLKPSNILRLADGSIVVADLGVAKRDPRHSSVLTGTCAIVGTLAYLAPEQLLPEGSRLADRRSDLFQLGKILYQLVSGRAPAVVELDRLPPGLAHIVGRATAGSPVDRYPDVDSLLAALDAFEAAAIPEAERRGHLRDFLDRIGSGRRACALTGDELGEGISILRQFGGDVHVSGLSWFDSLPIALLRSLAARRPTDFHPVLNLYARRIRSEVAKKDFRYADLVASRMAEIFRASRHDGLRTRALEIVLVTAVALYRYSAMATFKELLREVKTLELALPVSEMLRDHLDEFREVSAALDPTRFHPAIRSVLDELAWIETVSF